MIYPMHRRSFGADPQIPAVSVPDANGVQVLTPSAAAMVSDAQLQTLSVGGEQPPPMPRRSVFGPNKAEVPLLSGALLSEPLISGLVWARTMLQFGYSVLVGSDTGPIGFLLSTDPNPGRRLLAVVGTAAEKAATDTGRYAVLARPYPGAGVLPLYESVAIGAGVLLAVVGVVAVARKK